VERGGITRNQPLDEEKKEGGWEHLSLSHPCKGESLGRKDASGDGGLKKREKPRSWKGGVPCPATGKGVTHYAERRIKTIWRLPFGCFPKKPSKTRKQTMEEEEGGGVGQRSSHIRLERAETEEKEGQENLVGQKGAGGFWLAGDEAKEKPRFSESPFPVFSVEAENSVTPSSLKRHDPGENRCTGDPHKGDETFHRAPGPWGETFLLFSPQFFGKRTNLLGRGASVTQQGQSASATKKGGTAHLRPRSLIRRRRERGVVGLQKGSLDAGGGEREVGEKKTSAIPGSASKSPMLSISLRKT